MSTFKAFNTTTPYSNNDEVLQLYIDSMSDGYILRDVVKVIGTYTFSIWHKSEKNSTITFNLFGNTEQISSSTQWKKYSKIIEISSLSNTDIYIIPSLNTYTYFYEGFLSEGNLKNASWTPAPEEIVSKIEQTANSIRAEISATNGTITALTADLNGISGNVKDINGNISKLEQRAESVEAEIKNARGESSSLSVRIDGIESKVVDENGNSLIDQTAKDILLSVENTIGETKQVIEDDINDKLSSSREFMGIRYIRDWLNGNANILGDNQTEIPNRWVECQVLVNEEDIAAGIIPTCYNGNLSLINISNQNPAVYTNEMILEIPDEEGNISATEGDVDPIAVPLQEQYIELTGKHCLQVDLGQVYYNIDTIRIWHYYIDNDSYNHKLEVSSDGQEWVTLFDSDISGGYAETENGKIYHFSNYAIDKTIAQIQLDYDAINLRVQDNANNFSNLSLTAAGINSAVGTLEDKHNSLDNLLQKTKQNLEEDLGSIKSTYTTITQTKDLIAESVSNINGEIEAQVALSAQGWKGKFATLGMMSEDPEIQNKAYTFVTMSGNGLEVGSEDGKKRTLVTTDGFSGYYDNNEIFKLDEQGCWTGRAYINNGWQTPGIKMIPIEYSSDGNTVSGVVYVKAGGAL